MILEISQTSFCMHAAFFARINPFKAHLDEYCKNVEEYDVNIHVEFLFERSPNFLLDQLPKCCERRTNSTVVNLSPL
jgi:hypothetical protein